jgi:hypothetical protein
MNLWRHFRNLLAYLAPEPSLVSPRKHISVVAALLGVAAIAGAVVLTPSHRGKSPKSSPDVWETLRERVSDRAQVDLFDDFSEGLDAWQGDKSLASAWSYDKNGFINPSTLSLFQPSMRLTNYDVDALVQIEAKGLGLVFRAASSRTYQAAQILQQGSGPMPSLVVERYAMIAGHASRVVRTPYPERFQLDTMYRIHLEVRGDAFALYIQGNLMAYWSDTRLAAGGVGIFCLPGQRARVAWIRVSHNTDSTGRMCALLASVL